MAVFDAIRTAVLRCTGAQIDEAYSSSDPVAVEMADLANAVAEDIIESADWRTLVRVATVESNGEQEHDLPADYARMTVGAQVADPVTWFWGYHPFTDVDQWMRFKAGGFLMADKGGWIILGGKLVFYPAPSGSAQYPYVSRFYARGEDGVLKGAFTADNDTFVLSERLLTLGLVWQWKSQKGLEYGEDMANYERLLAHERSSDKGSYVTVMGGRSRMLSGRYAFSGRDFGAW